MGTTTIPLPVPRDIVTSPSLADLYERYADTVFRTAIRVTGSAADAEDVLQTVFLRLLHRDLAPEETRTPEAYLRRAATNAAIDVLRRRATRGERAAEDHLPAPESPPLLKERLRRAIAELAPRDAELFTLRYLEGFGNTELAGMLGMEKATVATRLHRIRLSLQEIL